MAAFTHAATILFVVSCTIGFSHVAAVLAPNYDKLWVEFKVRFGKQYRNDSVAAAHFQTFKSNVDWINKENSENHTYTLGITQFTDSTAEELLARRKRARKSVRWSPGRDKGYKGCEDTLAFNIEEVPASVDWVSQGFATPVGDQGDCNTCWAYSAAGSIEAAWWRATGKLVPLSQQMISDCMGLESACDKDGYTEGEAMWWASQHGLCTRDTYPDANKDEVCKDAACTVGVPIGSVTNCFWIDDTSERNLMAAVAQQPVSVGLNADTYMFNNYESGIMQGPCPGEDDHGVLLVGYGTENGVDYWKIKNSWATTWGENGYGRLKRGVPDPGQCHIRTNNNVIVKVTSGKHSHIAGKEQLQVLV